MLGRRRGGHPKTWSLFLQGSRLGQLLRFPQRPCPSEPASRSSRGWPLTPQAQRVILLLDVLQRGSVLYCFRPGHFLTHGGQQPLLGTDRSVWPPVTMKISRNHPRDSQHSRGWVLGPQPLCPVSVAPRWSGLISLVHNRLALSLWPSQAGLPQFAVSLSHCTHRFLLTCLPFSSGCL